MSEQVSQELFDFLVEEESLVKALMLAVRALSRRDDASSEKLHLSAILLRVLERLPIVTPSVGMELRLTSEDDNGRDVCTFAVDGESFRIGNIRSYYQEFGTDTEIEDVLEVGIGWRRIHCDLVELEDWVNDFLARSDDPGIKWEFDDYAESSIDWHDAEIGDSYWEKLESQCI